MLSHFLCFLNTRNGTAGNLHYVPNKRFVPVNKSISAVVLVLGYGFSAAVSLDYHIISHMISLQQIVCGKNSVWSMQFTLMLTLYIYELHPKGGDYEV